MPSVIDKNTKVICQGALAPAPAMAVCAEIAIVTPHSFTHPADLLRETQA